MSVKKLPEIDELKRLRYDEGLKLREIAEMYDCSITAVRLALMKEGPGNQEVGKTYRDIVPWKVDQRFFDTAVMNHLRVLARQYGGVRLSSEEQRRIKEWFDLMAENHVVLDYSPDAPPNHASPVHGGFYYRTRVPEDQSNFWRDPAVNLMLEERKQAAIDRQADHRPKARNGQHS